MNIKDAQFSKPYRLLSNGKEVLLKFNRDLSKRIVRLPWILKGILFPSSMEGMVWRELRRLIKVDDNSLDSINDERKVIYITTQDEGNREIHAEIKWEEQRGWFSIEWKVGRMDSELLDRGVELCNLLNAQILFGHVYIDAFNRDIKLKFFFHQDLVLHDRAWVKNAYLKSFWEAYYLHEPFEYLMRSPDRILEIFDDQVNRAKFSAS